MHQHHREGKLHEDGELCAYSLHYRVLHCGRRTATGTRGLRIPSMVEASAYLDGFQVLTGILDTVKLMARSIVFSTNESGLVDKLVFSKMT